MTLRLGRTGLGAAADADPPPWCSTSTPPGGRSRSGSSPDCGATPAVLPTDTNDP
jgi:hypothetical protein